MNRVQQVTDDPKQSFTITTQDGDQFALSIWYVPQQIGWFFSLVYGDFTIGSMRITASQNMLDQFSNLIPFGLACLTSIGQEPLLQEDFALGNANLYVLDAVDLAALEAFINGD